MVSQLRPQRGELPLQLRGPVFRFERALLGFGGGLLFGFPASLGFGDCLLLGFVAPLGFGSGLLLGFLASLGFGSGLLFGG